MGPESSVGRRRAPAQRSEHQDRSASHAEMASMWSGVSSVHEAIGQRLLRFEDTPTDSRLSEQLSLLPVLHDWLPVTVAEASDLVYLLDLYVAPAADATPDDVSRALGATIRTMAVRRAATGQVLGPDL